MTNEKKQYRKKQESNDLLLNGKVPPHAKEVEAAILGAIMLERNAIDQVSDILSPEAFYSDAHQRIYRAMLRLSESNSIDLLTVVQALKATEELDLVGGPYYITTLTNNVVGTAHLEVHCRLVQEKYMLRELARIGSNLMGKGYDESTDVFDLLDEADTSITDLAIGNLKKNYSHLNKTIAETVARIEELRKSDETIIGVPSGFTAIDKLTHGWQSPDLIILAARPSVGKTAFALNLARYASNNPLKSVPVGFFSMEMSAGQLGNRLLSAESGIWLEKIITGKMEDHHVAQLYNKGVANLSNSPIYIDDSGGLTLHELRSRARSMKRKEKVGLIIIDYLQLMSGGTGNKNGNREQEISTISRGLKKLAKELQIPIIALSQLSRETEKRSGDKKMPQLSDLRESGAIEQDADIVMFMYRPEYYNQGANEWGESTAGETHIRFAKNRNGSLDTIILRAELSIQKFHDFDGAAAVTEKLGKGTWQPVSNILSSKEDVFDE